MTAISHNYNQAKPHAVLMKGRPEEPESWQSIAVYTKDEEREFRRRGWKHAKEFMEQADRARRRD